MLINLCKRAVLDESIQSYVGQRDRRIGLASHAASLNQTKANALAWWFVPPNFPSQETLWCPLTGTFQGTVGRRIEVLTSSMTASQLASYVLGSVIKPLRHLPTPESVQILNFDPVLLAILIEWRWEGAFLRAERLGPSAKWVLSWSRALPQKLGGPSALTTAHPVEVSFDDTALWFYFLAYDTPLHTLGAWDCRLK